MHRFIYKKKRKIRGKMQSDSSTGAALENVTSNGFVSLALALVIKNLKISQISTRKTKCDLNWPQKAMTFFFFFR